MCSMKKYEYVKDIACGNFGVTKLMRNKDTNELVAMKFIPRGETINKNVSREIINHRSLKHPNIILFKELLLTPKDIVIVMEYAPGGELFDRLRNCKDGCFSEDEARYFFQQLITGVGYCHSLGICHRDLKLENVLLVCDETPILKICDFGYSKSLLLHSKAKSTVGTPAYLAPEILSRKEYDGMMTDVWSCGVVLYIMLFGAYPFEDPNDPTNIKSTLTNIMTVQYKIPEKVSISEDCKDLLSRIFVKNPLRRISINSIKCHPWFLKKLPSVLKEANQAKYYNVKNQSLSLQSEKDIMRIIEEAKKVPADEGEEDNENGYEKTVIEVHESTQVQIKVNQLQIEE